MFLRIDKLQYDMPVPGAPDPNAAAAVQELMGGRFGEMSTLMNYMYQSFNFRGRDKLRPYYALISNIATEELGHIELVAASVNSLLNGIRSEGDPATGAASFMNAFKDARLSHHHIAMGHGIMAANSMGQPWRGDYVFNSGNLVLDLLHNFFLENGARTQKLRVYEMTDNKSARSMLGYLFVRGGVHAHAYALALEQLTGVEMKKMLPIPNIENVQLPEVEAARAGGPASPALSLQPGRLQGGRRRLAGDGARRLGSARGRRRPAAGPQAGGPRREHRRVHPRLPSAGNLRDGPEALPEGQRLTAARDGGALARRHGGGGRPERSDALTGLPWRA